MTLDAVVLSALALAAAAGALAGALRQVFLAAGGGGEGERAEDDGVEGHGAAT